MDCIQLIRMPLTTWKNEDLEQFRVITERILFYNFYRDNLLL
jgi:hypothetical protein